MALRQACFGSSTSLSGAQVTEHGRWSKRAGFTPQLGHLLTADLGEVTLPLLPQFSHVRKEENSAQHMVRAIEINTSVAAAAVLNVLGLESDKEGLAYDEGKSSSPAGGGLSRFLSSLLRPQAKPSLHCSLLQKDEQWSRQ